MTPGDATDPRVRVVQMPDFFGRGRTDCWGARCTACGAWLTKWDYTPADAQASAVYRLDATNDDKHQHSSGAPGPRELQPGQQARLL